MNEPFSVPEPAIEWSPPQINCVRSALDDASCLIERLRALLGSANEDLHHQVIEGPVAQEPQATSLYNLWLIFEIAAEKLEEVDRVVSAITSAAYEERLSPVARHTRIKRAERWRAVADALNAANGSSDMSDEAIADAGRWFQRLVQTRVSSLDDFREKLLLMSSNAGINESNLDELLLDLEGLGARAAREIAA